jgi:hypothetical protein
MNFLEIPTIGLNHREISLSIIFLLKCREGVLNEIYDKRRSIRNEELADHLLMKTGIHLIKSVKRPQKINLQEMLRAPIKKVNEFLEKHENGMGMIFPSHSRECLKNQAGWVLLISGRVTESGWNQCPRHRDTRSLINRIKGITVHLYKITAQAFK